MPTDIFTERTRQGWGGRIGNSIKGVVVGLLLFVAAFPLLFWNEGRAVRTAQTLEEGAAATVHVAADRVDPQNEGKLVHLIGRVTTSQTLRDDLFNVSAKAVALVRHVEMYQWKEKKQTKEERKVGGSSETVTTYTYSTDWSSRLIRSSDFKKPEGHQNPTSIPLQGTTVYASEPRVGAFTLSRSLLEKVPAREPLAVTDQAGPAGEQGRTWRVADGRFYRGTDPTNPQVGDVRVFFTIAPEGEVSLIAQQSGESFVPYVARTGKTIELLSAGQMSKEEMYQAEVRKNTILTWALRGGGWLLMLAGLAMVAAPLGVLADVLPIFGDITRAGAGLVAFAVATPLSLLTIAVAWFAYRPLLSVVLVVLGVVVFVMVKWMVGQRARATEPAPMAGA